MFTQIFGNVNLQEAATQEAVRNNTRKIIVQVVVVGLIVRDILKNT